MDIENELDTSAQEAFRVVFGKIGGERARRIINVLLESPFFYRDDDIDLFGVLKRRRSVFADFFEAFFGWELYVDDYVARLVKPDVYNTALRPTQRHLFRLSGRHEYVLFVLLLEFHQLQADEQNIDLDECDEVRFVLGDFVDFVFKRYKETLVDMAPREEMLLDACRSLFRTLEQFRFIAVREKKGIVAEEGLKAGFTVDGKGDVLYALLPGLRCYRAEVLTAADMLGRAVPTDNVDVVAIEENGKPISAPYDEDDESLSRREPEGQK